MSKKIIVFGITEVGELAHYYFNLDGGYKVTAFTINKEYIEKETFDGLPIVPFEEIEKIYPPSEYKMFIAIGYTGVNKLRESVCKMAREKGYELASYISPRATVFDNVKTGDNNFILEDNTVQPFVTIGNNVTLWSGNHIGHHSVIEDNCFITSHVVVSGGCTVGKNSFIGVNATLRDHISIGKENVIGAAAIILKDTKEKEIYKLNAKGVASKLLSDQINF